MKLSYFITALLPAVLASELKIETVEPVECSRPSKNGDLVSVHYSGFLGDGKKFDSSYDRGTPLTFKLGSGQVIKGWEQGIVGMCPGEKRKLTIPPELGYGSRGIGPIPPNSELIFDTELVDIAGLEKDEL